MHELIPWRTLTGRQQFYMDHPWMIAFGEGFSSYRPPVDLKTTAGIHGIKSNGNPEILLNFITPHQKWGIHSTYTDNLMMLTLSRGGPCIWLSEDDAKRAGIVDNDWVELFNINGAIAARAVVSQRVNPGMVMMYHAQEKIVNTPGSEITGVRGGIHNSVTRIVLKPTHMIGGYAQFSYGFNYYGTIGTNRDEFVVVRKMDKVDWLDTRRRSRPGAGERMNPTLTSVPRGAGLRQLAGGRMKIRAQIGMVLNLDKCIGCHTCSVTCKNVWTSRPGMEYAWFNNVETKPGIGYPKEWENQDKWNGGWVRKADGSIEPRQGAKWKLLMRIFANPNLPQIDDYYEPFTFDYDHLQSAPEMKAAPTARPRSLITGMQMDKIVWGPNWEEILGGEFAKRSKDRNFDDIQKDIYGQFENTFMMYLPRLCEHCLNPACVASCPSGSIYKREEDGIVLIDQDKCRGWRMCVSGCPYKKIYYNWKSGKAEKCIFCYPRIEAGQPTVCSETCVGRIRYLGVLLYDADRIDEAASVEHDRDLYEAQLSIFLDPERPEGDRAGARRRHSRQLARGGAQEPRLQDGGRLEGRAAAAPGVPDAADGLVRAAAVADHRRRQRGARRHQRRDPGRQPAAHPGQVPGQPADRRRHGARRARARAHARDARLPAREARRRRSQHGRAGAGRHHAGRGRGHVPGDGDRQLRGPLRHPVHAPRIRGERVQRARRLRLLVRQRLLRGHQRDEPLRQREETHDSDQGEGMNVLGLSRPVCAPGTLRVLAALLSYPDADVRRHLPEMRGNPSPREARCRPAGSPSSTR